MSTAQAKVTLFRFDPTTDKEPRHETYILPAEAWENRRVMDVIHYIYEHMAPDLSFREPCGVRICGCCAIKVNNKPVLACDAFAEKEMVIEPLAIDRVIKDLAVKM